MRERSSAMMRWLPEPVPVLVDPRAVLVLPARWPRPNERPLGVTAGGLDLRLDEQWIPATLHRWLRIQLGFWAGEVEICYSSRNGQLRVPVRQWVHQQALRPVTDP